MHELELYIDKNKPWEGQICAVRNSEDKIELKDKAEITNVEWIDGTPILAFTLLRAGRRMGGEVTLTEGQDGQGAD